jgi:hypothetical protein
MRRRTSCARPLAADAAGGSSLSNGGNVPLHGRWLAADLSDVPDVPDVPKPD